MGLSAFAGLCALMLVVILVMMIIFFITSIRLSEERENNFLLSSMLEQRENELRELRNTRPNLAGRHRG
jgi:signal transduction histidine kinase